MRFESICVLLVAAMGCRSGDKGVVDTAGDAVDVVVDADGDGFGADEDCDDNNAFVNPAAEEICDGVDNNCDMQIDEGVTSAFYADTDGDGFGDPDAAVEACELLDGHVAIGNDCDDSNAETYPGAPERCDGLDNDCDELIDEDVLSTWYADADADGHGDPDAAVDACDPPSGYVDTAQDCDDTNPDANPDATEVCDEADNDCDNETDEGVTTTFYVDTDGDQYGISDETTEACSLPTGYAAEPGDCNDGDSAVNPAATEVCNSIDDDCDLAVDEGVTTTFYADSDSDGFGDIAATTEACAVPSGYVEDSTDCDDGDGSVNPDADERCNGDDDDCDGSVDEDDAIDASTWYADADSDGYGNPDRTDVSCAMPSGYVADNTDCDDLEGSSNPAASEVCDEADNDCDGTVDEGVTTTFYADTDNDGHGDPDSTTEACSAPSGYEANGDDCDDGDGAISPNGTEVCDGVDNDCDDSVDEDDAVDADTFYADSDGDGFGDPDSTTEACDVPSGHVADDSDCDDGDGAVNTDADEICDSIDNDCDGRIDDDDSDVVAEDAYYADDDGDGYGDPDDLITACSAPSGYVDDNTDCVPDDGDIFPESDGTCPWGLTCADILDRGLDDGDGTYTIDPDGSGGGLDPFDVYCDMTTDGGGWTEIAYDSDLDFDQHFSDGDYYRWMPDDFTFALSDDQIAGIQAESSEGYQAYVGLCEHVIHHYYNYGGNYNYAFGFQFFDGTTTPYGAASYSPYSITVASDGCSGNGGEGGAESDATVFEFDSVLVPVLNVYCRDCGDTTPEMFGSPLTDNPAWLR